ncbi:MAG TPA: hypothetical protein DCY15_00500 [Ruminococcaceae bacterium]|nr:hypothetical protein [Oscillospiraceae bacterium]
MNKLYRITTEEFEKEKILYARDDTKYIVMDGDGVNTYEEYFDRLWAAFDFCEIPDGWKKDTHTEYDFMTDNDFVPEKRYVFVIKNYDEFLRHNISERKNIEDTFGNYLLPFWDSEVETCVVGGKRKDFDIYLVSNK